MNLCDEALAPFFQHEIAIIANLLKIKISQAYRFKYCLIEKVKFNEQIRFVDLIRKNEI
jgi:hypothetical protein